MIDIYGTSIGVLYLRLNATNFHISGAYVTTVLAYSTNVSSFDIKTLNNGISGIKSIVKLADC